VLTAGAGCTTTGQKETPPEKTPTPTASPATPFTATPSPAPEPVTIRWWSFQAGDSLTEYMREQIDAFETIHPYVTIQWTPMDRDAFKLRIADALLSEKPPDLFQNEGDYLIALLADAGLIRDIPAELGTGGDADFLKTALERFAYDGKQYGLPRDVSVTGIWYNQSLFRRAGIMQTPGTWDTLLSNVQKIKWAGFTPIALGEGDKWSGALWWESIALRLGGCAAMDAILSGKGAFTDSPFVRAGEELRKLILLYPFDEDFLNLHTYPGASTVFGNGMAAMHLMGQWEAEYQELSSDSGLGIGDDLGWFPFPAVEGGAGDPGDLLGGINGWLIGADAPAETVDFLEFISSGTAQCRMAGLGMLPASDSAGSCLQDPFLTEIWKALQQSGYLQIYYDIFLPPAAGQAVNDAVGELYAGASSPEDAAQQIETAYSEEDAG
jgi:raffinose/stachyose/melibiose transport system substrate-binding protein